MLFLACWFYDAKLTAVEKSDKIELKETNYLLGKVRFTVGYVFKREKG
jgi:hypothetical protein